LNLGVDASSAGICFSFVVDAKTIEDKCLSSIVSMIL